MQVLFNGVVVGLIGAVFALAFTIVYLPTRVFHLALAAVFVVAPYIAWAAQQAGWPQYLSIGVAILSGVVLSSLCELVNHRWLERKRAHSGSHLVSSLGINILLVQVVALVWGNQSKVLRVGPHEVYQLGVVVVTGVQLIALCSTLALLGGFALWLMRSRVGLQFRALADNPTEVALCCYNVDRLRMLAFAVSGLLASCAGILMAYDLGFDPYIGLPALLAAVVAAIIGGSRTFVGPVIGGLVLGVVRSEVVWYGSHRWREAATFLLLAVFLMLRPQGLFGSASRAEAEA